MFLKKEIEYRVTPLNLEKKKALGVKVHAIKEKGREGNNYI